MTKKLNTQPETVAEVTARAIRSAQSLIPPTVFVPLDLRRSRRRLTKGRVTASPASENEIAERISSSAPHEFLIAVMTGQPVPQFVLTEGQGHVDVDVSYVVPTMEERLNAAGHLASWLGKKAPAPRDTDRVDYDAAIKNAAQHELNNPSQDVDKLHKDC